MLPSMLFVKAFRCNDTSIGTLRTGLSHRSTSDCWQTG